MSESGQEQRVTWVPWRPWEDALIKEHYSAPGWIKRVAEATGRPLYGVKMRALRMGLRKPIERRPWRKKEVAILHRHYGKRGWKQTVARITKRTETSCLAAARRYGLVGSLQLRWSAREIETLDYNWPKNARTWRKLLPRRTPVAVYLKGLQRGHPARFAEGKITLSAAADLMGFAIPAALNVLRWAGVRTRHHKKRKAPGLRYYLDPDEAKQAALAWTKTMTVREASALIGCRETRVRLALRDAGYAPRDGYVWRIDPEPDEALAKVPARRRYPRMPWRVDLAMLREILAARTASVKAARAGKRIDGFNASLNGLARKIGVSVHRVSKAARTLGLVSKGQRNGGRAWLTEAQFAVLEKQVRAA